MEIRTPPRVDDFASLAEWKQARTLYFKNLPRRDRTRKVVEVEVIREVERVVEVPVETVREVERVVYVDRVIEAAPAEVEMPDFLKYDPLTEFIATEQREGETDEATLQRLRDELLDYFSLERGDGLTAAEADRKRYLSSHITPTGD
jgi:hypothetical protein